MRHTNETPRGLAAAGFREGALAGRLSFPSNKPNQNEAQGLTAFLHAPSRGMPYRGYYSVSFRGEIIVRASRLPEIDLALALLAKGITGHVKVAAPEQHREFAGIAG
jgi:hypothetical protein